MLGIGAGIATAEQQEIIWEQRFTENGAAEAWELSGTARMEDGALYTCSDPEGTSSAVSQTQLAIPAASDGYLLRMEWSLVPVRIGGWGQDANTGGPFVVEFTGKRPTLNAAHRAKTTVAPGASVILSCDFNQHQVFDWRINGVAQLDQPVPAWRPNRASAPLSFSDFKDTNSETRWLWVRVSKIIPDDPTAMLVSGWERYPEVKPNERLPFLVGVASPMDKVFREARDFTGRLNSTVQLAAAGRESESFQLVVIPTSGALHGVEVVLSDLLHSDGATRLDQENLSWHPVGYVQTRQSNSSMRRAGWWWPDVLLPRAAFDVESGFVQPIWFTVSVPHGTKPGVYHGVIRIMADDAVEHIGLELQVRSFSLPVRGVLKTAFCFNPGIWEMWYAPDAVKKTLGLDDNCSHGPLYTSYECEDVLPREDWLRLYDFLLAHRLSPTQIYSSLKGGKSRVFPAHRDMDYCYERGMNATCLANVDVLPKDPEAADTLMAELEAWIASWEEFVKEKDWQDFTWYVHGFDESEMRKDPVENVDPSLHRVFGMLADKFPWLKRESANPIIDKHVGYINVWTPLTQQLPEKKMEMVRERQAAGDEVWAYVCCGPGRPYANLFIDFPGVDPRILPWQFFQQGMTGFLYYLINLYDGQENWNMDAPKWPERPWNPYSFRTNSDGILMYPGPDKEPLASTRMENLRDGIEDYEALAILASLVEKAAADDAHADFAAAAKAVLAVKPEITTSWKEYTQNPDTIISARAEVDELIEEGLTLTGTNTP